MGEVGNRGKEENREEIVVKQERKKEKRKEGRGGEELKILENQIDGRQKINKLLDINQNAHHL